MQTSAPRPGCLLIHADHVDVVLDPIQHPMKTLIAERLAEKPKIIQKSLFTHLQFVTNAPDQLQLETVQSIKFHAKPKHPQEIGVVVTTAAALQSSPNLPNQIVKGRSEDFNAKLAKKKSVEGKKCVKKIYNRVDERTIFTSR